MSEQGSSAENDGIHDGVLAAVIHVAAVSAADTKDLVREFDAARAAIKSDSKETPNNALLAAVFAHGLSTARLKAIVQEHWVSGTELESLRASLAIVESHYHDERSTYCEWVMHAAHAAARAEVNGGIFSRRRVTHLEKVALAEIRAVLESR